MTTNYGADMVAAGNGLEENELPEFKAHVHTETDTGVHTSWEDCAMTMCTWAGCYDWARDAAVAKVGVEHA